MTRASLAGLVASLAWTPALALACPVCIGANEANRDAFLLTTAFLSLFPLAMIGCLIGFLVQRARAAESQDVTETEAEACPRDPAPDVIAPTADGGAPR